MKIYHYTRIDRWLDINSWQPDAEPGLRASLRVCTGDSEDKHAGDMAVFGLLDPKPESWIKNTEYPLAWQSLMRKTGKLLLEYRPTNEIIDRSFIIDWSCQERALGGHKDSLGQYSNQEIPREERLTAEKAYWASRIPLASYIENPQVIADIGLPEVITMCDIPINMVEVPRIQPRLHNLYAFAKQGLREVIQYDPKLASLAVYTD